jgi:hypothetical protein
MNPDPADPLLRALFDDDAWRASCREMHAKAAARLRRRRCWRKLRPAMLALALVGGLCWFARNQSPAHDSPSRFSSATPAPDHLRLHLALNVPVVADGPLTVRAYDPLPDWTLHCEPLADYSPPSPLLLQQPTFKR